MSSKLLWVRGSILLVSMDDANQKTGVIFWENILNSYDLREVSLGTWIDYIFQQTKKCKKDNWDSVLRENGNSLVTNYLEKGLFWNYTFVLNV